MKSLSGDLVAALEVFPEVPPTMMRTLRHMKSRVYDDGVRPVYLPAWKEVAERFRTPGGPMTFGSDYVFKDMDETD